MCMQVSSPDALLSRRAKHKFGKAMTPTMPMSMVAVAMSWWRQAST